MHKPLCITFLLCLFVSLSLSIAQPLILNCSPKNDLYKTLIDNGVNNIRYGSLDLAIQNADLGWDAWATETGWTQGWITSMLMTWEDKAFKPKGIYYLCVTQKNGEKAWSSPVWVHL
ncbi:hypothetical protein GF406_03775 [candidate division KSB1 bacterium]|nr:hypothetical protein [candidate division KSB1 bacterium]